MHEVSGFKEDFLSKATEKTLALYFDLIGEALQKECGEKPYTNKVSKESIVKQVYLSEDSIILK